MDVATEDVAICCGDFDGFCVCCGLHGALDDGHYRREQTGMCVLLTARTVARPMLK